MNNIINEYLKNIIPSNLVDKSNNNEILNIMLKNNLGNKMLQYVQDLNLSRSKRSKGLIIKKINITWIPNKEIKNLNCLMDIYIISNLYKSEFGNLVRIYSQYLSKIKLRAWQNSKKLNNCNMLYSYN